MVNIVAGGILILIIAGIIGYLIHEKKRGNTCIGCPYAKQCKSKCSGECSCRKENQ